MRWITMLTFLTLALIVACADNRKAKPSLQVGPGVQKAAGNTARSVKSDKVLDIGPQMTIGKTASTLAKPAEIRLMVLVSPKATRGFEKHYTSASAAIISIEKGVNEALQNSGINASISIVRVEPIQTRIARLGDKATLKNLVAGSGDFRQIGSLRDQTGADAVILIGEMVVDCGLAANNAVSAENSFALVDWRCSDMADSPLSSHGNP